MAGPEGRDRGPGQVPGLADPGLGPATSIHSGKPGGCAGRKAPPIAVMWTTVSSVLDVYFIHLPVFIYLWPFIYLFNLKLGACSFFRSESFPSP